MSRSSLFARLGAALTHDRSIGFGLERLGRATLRFPRLMALLVLTACLLAALQLPRAAVDGDLLRVYAQSGPEYDAYRRLADSFGTFENDIYVVVTAPRLTEPEVLERLRNLAFDLELNEYAAGTLSPFALRRPVAGGGTAPAIPDNLASVADAEALLAGLAADDPMMRNLINPDLSGMVMIVFPDPELSQGAGAREMIASLEATIATYRSAGIDVALTGPPVWTGEMLHAAVDDQIKFTLYGFGLGALIALISLRSLAGALLVAATPALAVLWVMGAILFSFGSFSFLTLLVTTLVLVIAFAESLFFVFNWLAYWREGMEPRAAVAETVRVVGPASALTMLTTLVSFASLGLAPGRGIGEFAIAGVMACVLSFVCLMTFLPLLLKLALRLGFRPPRPSAFVLTAPMRASWFLGSRWARPMTAAAIVVTALLFIPYLAIQPHFSFEEIVAKNSTALTAAAAIDDGVGGVAPLYVRLPLAEATPGLADSDYARLKIVQAIMEKRLGTGKVISVASFENYAGAGFGRVELLDAVGPFLKRRFVSDDGRQALITGFMPTIVDSATLKQTVHDLRADLDAAGFQEAEIGGFRVLTTFATDNIVRSLQLDFTLSVVVNLFLIGFAFASIRVAFATAIPNLFPVLGTEAFLWLTGQGLQLTTMLSLTIAFGIAVDDTTHFLAHYLHERRHGGQPHREAVRRTMFRIGGAIVATTIILCAGTGIVTTSQMPQVALFGQLFVATLLLALVGDLFVLPALLLAFERFFSPLGGVRVPAAEAVPPVDRTGGAAG